MLSHLADRVFSIEHIPDLARTARRRIVDLGYHNIEVICGDGSLGFPERAPFDSIVATAVAPALPPACASRITEGGRIVIPIGHAKTQQRMRRFTRRGDHLIAEDRGGFAFVPLIGKQGW